MGCGVRRRLSRSVLSLSVSLCWTLLGGAGIAFAQDGRENPKDGPHDPLPPEKSLPPEKKDDRSSATDEAAKVAIERFEREFKDKDGALRASAIDGLGATRNDLVTKKLGTLLEHREVPVRLMAAEALEGQSQNRLLSGELLRKAVVKEEDSEVVVAIAATLGRIQYVRAIPSLGEAAFRSRDVRAKLEILKVLARMKDLHALLPILDLWLVHPMIVAADPAADLRLDAGAAGEADPAKAEDAFRVAYGEPRRKGPPLALKGYVIALADAAEKLAGEKVAGPGDLMLWLVRHEAELGFRLPAKVKAVLREYQERAAKPK